MAVSRLVGVSEALCPLDERLTTIRLAVLPMKHQKVLRDEDDSEGLHGDCGIQARQVLGRVLLAEDVSSYDAATSTSPDENGCSYGSFHLAHCISLLACNFRFQSELS
jgi:hypothetical protein